MTDPAARYVYAIVPERTAEGLALQGIGGAGVEVVTAAGIAAVVSPIADRTIRPVRRNLAAHHAVQKAVAEISPSLPMGFGMISESVAAVRRLLEANGDALAEKLETLAGCAEMSVRVAWDVDNVFEHLLARSDELRAARDRMLAAAPQNRDEQIAAGELFAAILQEERERHAAAVEAALRPACERMEPADLKRDDDLARFACLVRLPSLDRFERALADAAEAFADDILFEYAGPWPPHTFAGADLDLIDPAA